MAEKIAKEEKGGGVDMVEMKEGCVMRDFGYGSEKLDYMFASESTVPEAAVLSVNRSVEVGGEDGRGGKSEETGTFEDCDGGIVAVGSESRVAEASVSSVEGLVGVSTEDRRGGMKEEEGIDENCDEDAVATASESRAAEAAVLSVDNLVRVVGEDGSVEGINEEDGKDVDCDGNKKMSNIFIPLFCKFFTKRTILRNYHCRP